MSGDLLQKNYKKDAWSRKTATKVKINPTNQKGNTDRERERTYKNVLPQKQIVVAEVCGRGIWGNLLKKMIKKDGVEKYQKGNAERERQTDRQRKTERILTQKSTSCILTFIRDAMMTDVWGYVSM